MDSLFEGEFKKDMELKETSEKLGDGWGISAEDFEVATVSTFDMDNETLTTARSDDEESDACSVESEEPENDDKDKSVSLMQPQHLAHVHPFIEVLHERRDGIAVDCGDDWAWDVIEKAVERGPHPTAMTEES